MTGVYRYIRHHDVADRLAEGWRWCCTLGEDSALMIWCCGDCKAGEAP